jgi:hypothetical protein
MNEHRVPRRAFLAGLGTTAILPALAFDAARAQQPGERRRGVHEKGPERVWFQIGDTRLGVEQAQPGQKPHIEHDGITVELNAS